MPENLSTRRLKWLLWLMLGWSGAVFARLLSLEVIHHDDLLRRAQQQQQKVVQVASLRGSILDRNGQPLAKTLFAESVCVNPLRLRDMDVAAEILARSLDLDQDALLEKIRSAAARGSGFLWVKRRISTEEADRLRSLKIDWIEFRTEMRRFYPQGQLAAHVVGATGMTSKDDTVEHGSAGVELKFDDVLSGEPGLERVFTDVRQTAYDAVVTRKPEPGANLRLTIDSGLQYVAERALEQAVKASGAKTGSVVALNPVNGDVLVMANYPTYDPNSAPTPSDPPNARSNLAVTTPFEPGSVFKVITLSSALETTRLRPDSIINCGNGVITLFGRVIHDHASHSALSMADVLAHSSNIGAINIALKVGNLPFYRYARAFGFGRRTGIALPGESPGLLRRPADWTPSSIGSLAMGQEISATALQLAVAGAVVANGGLRIAPRVVLARQNPGEPEETFATESPERILKPETAIQMRQMMEGVVLRGTGKRATLRGYTSGGKTGSAQIYDLKAHVYTHHYNGSFLGFAPVTNPAVVISVTLNGTSGGGGFGGEVAAPVFKIVAEAALRVMDVPKDIPDESTAVTSVRETTDENDLSIAGLGDPAAVEQALSSVTPPPVQESASATADASSSDRRPFFDGHSVTGPKVPDFRGKSLRVVLEQSTASGLPVEVTGSGMARAQDPSPGSILAPGGHIRIEFTQ